MSDEDKPIEEEWEYKIMWQSGPCSWEEIDGTDDLDNAFYLLGEYSFAYPAGSHFKILDINDNEVEY